MIIRHTATRPLILSDRDSGHAHVVTEGDNIHVYKNGCLNGSTYWIAYHLCYKTGRLYTYGECTHKGTVRKDCGDVSWVRKLIRRKHEEMYVRV